MFLNLKNQTKNFFKRGCVGGALAEREAEEGEEAGKNFALVAVAAEEWIS